jgi:hypothetical protein
MVPRDSWSPMGFLFLPRTGLFPSCILIWSNFPAFFQSSASWCFHVFQIHKFYPTSNSIQTTQWCKHLCYFHDICKISIELEVAWFVQIKQHKDIAHFETAYVVKLHRVARLAPPQEVRDHTCAQCPSLIMWYYHIMWYIAFPWKLFHHDI